MVRDFLSAHLDLMGELFWLLVIIGIIIVAAGFVIARFDRIPLEEALYLAVITAFTVGFGDITPRSRAARVACIVLAFLGLVLVGLMVAVAVHALDIVLSSRAG